MNIDEIKRLVNAAHKDCPLILERLDFPQYFKNLAPGRSRLFLWTENGEMMIDTDSPEPGNMDREWAPMNLSIFENKGGLGQLYEELNKEKRNPHAWTLHKDHTKELPKTLARVDYPRYFEGVHESWNYIHVWWKDGALHADVTIEWDALPINGTPLDGTTIQGLQNLLTDITSEAGPPTKETKQVATHKCICPSENFNIFTGNGLGCQCGGC